MQDSLSAELDLVRLVIVETGYNYSQYPHPYYKGISIYIRTAPLLWNCLWKSTSSLFTICRLALYPGMALQAVPSHLSAAASCLDEYEDPDIHTASCAGLWDLFQITLFILCVHAHMYAGAYVYSCLWMLEDSLECYSSGTVHFSFRTDFSHWNGVVKKARLDGWRALRIPG